MRWISALLLAINVGVSTGQTCANPLFADYQVTDSLNYPSMGTISVTTNTPAPFPGDQHSVCKSFVGQQSCCTTDTLKSIAKANSDMQNLVTMEKTMLSLTIHQATTNFTNSITASCALPDAPMMPWCQNLPTKLQSFTDAANQFVQDSTACIDALEAYNIGMRCFSCSASWGSYINAAESTVNINTNTCNNMIKACTPMNDAMISVINNIIIIVKPAASMIPGGDSLMANISAIPDLCGGKVSAAGDCKSNICSNWMEGPHAYGPKVPMPPAPARRLSSSEITSESAQGGIEGLLSQMVTHMMKMHASMELPAKRLLSLSATTQYTNTYSNTGFDAVAIGCGDSPAGIKACASSGNDDNDQNSPSNNGSSNAGSVAAGVIVLLIVVAIIGVVAVRRFRRRLRVNQTYDFSLANF